MELEERSVRLKAFRRKARIVSIGLGLDFHREQRNKFKKSADNSGRKSKHSRSYGYSPYSFF
ncbi:hypothetical protein D3C80_1858090 [compost metagenome]